jgi:hypothetical protein
MYWNLTDHASSNTVKRERVSETGHWSGKGKKERAMERGTGRKEIARSLTFMSLGRPKLEREREREENGDTQQQS